jgi:hypothetical protein
MTGHTRGFDDYSWESGEGLLGVSDPAIVDEALDRGEQYAGIAVTGLALNHDDLAEIAPRVARATRSDDAETRRMGFVALGHSVRLFGELPPALEQALRDARSDPAAETAFSDTLQFIPFARLPAWLKVRAVGEWISWHLWQRWKRSR